MNKKIPAIYLLCALLFALFCAVVISISVKINSTAKAAFTEILPARSVVIDAGHGGEDGGAVSEDGLVTEKDINLAVANDCADLLRLLGCKVIQTRSTDTALDGGESTVHARKTADLKKRLEIFNAEENSAVISIHQNKFSQSKYHGTQVFYSPNNQNSAPLAQSIQNAVKKLLQPENERECKKDDGSVYLLKKAETPAVIVECGFISNPDELEKLVSADYQKQLSLAICLGFFDYANGSSQ